MIKGLKNNGLFLLTMIWTTSINYSFSQNEDVNVLLVIDNQIVTNFINFSFVGDNTNYDFNYVIGEKLKLPSKLMQSEKISLKFKYTGWNNDYPKVYNYDFDFKKGWLNNTFFLIIRIYNLDKKRFKKAFCKVKKEYAIEVENSVYNQSEEMCRKLKYKF